MDQNSAQQPEEDQSQNLQGTEASLETPQLRNTALDQALDYRGDVTLHTADGRVLHGFVFDRRHTPQPHVRLLTSNDASRLEILDVDIKRLTFTGRDTAAGKSWETWVKKYQEKRAMGMPANLEPDSLD